MPPVFPPDVTFKAAAGPVYVPAPKPPPEELELEKPPDDDELDDDPPEEDELDEPDEELDEPPEEDELDEPDEELDEPPEEDELDEPPEEDDPPDEPTDEQPIRTRILTEPTHFAAKRVVRIQKAPSVANPQEIKCKPWCSFLANQTNPFTTRELHFKATIYMKSVYKLLRTDIPARAACLSAMAAECKVQTV